MDGEEPFWKLAEEAARSSRLSANEEDDSTKGCDFLSDCDLRSTEKLPEDVSFSFSDFLLIVRRQKSGLCGEEIGEKLRVVFWRLVLATGESPRHARGLSPR